MEEEETKKGSIDIDWEVLLPRREDEPPPVLVVTTTTNAAERKTSPLPMGGDQQEQSHREELERKRDSEFEEAISRQRRSVETLGEKPRASLKRLVDETERGNLGQVEKEQSQREELERKSDRELEVAISRQRHIIGTLGLRLSDGGEKLRASLKRFEDERERRKIRRVEKVDDGCQKLMQSKSPCFTSASDGFRQEAPSQSMFTTRFCRKLEENTDGRTVNAFEKELSYMGRCHRQKMRFNGQFSPRERHKSALSSRKSPFQCPTSVSVVVDKHVFSDGKNGGHCSTHSPRHVEEKLSGSFFMKEKASKILPLKDLRPRNGQTFVLVDEEEPQLIESLEQADKTVERMKESKIYYPSSDDPESIEIYYSDMECLAPEAFVSSTIMNFYIRYLQRLTSSTDSARSGCHFFNTYFYKKLTEAVFNKSDGESLFVKFRRWWKGVNIFHKAYILLPIHQNLHWSLVIICIPDKEDESGPIILHLDSLRLHYSKPIFDNIKSFLIEEWKYLNQGEAPPDLPIAYRVWKNLPCRIEERTIEVPQQRNDYDCGPFVLCFMERFIDEAPQRLKKQDSMFGKNWFKPEEASKMRRKIRKLLVEEFLNATKDNCVLDHVPLSSMHREGERIDHAIDC